MIFQAASKGLFESGYLPSAGNSPRSLAIHIVTLTTGFCGSRRKHIALAGLDVRDTPARWRVGRAGEVHAGGDGPDFAGAGTHEEVIFGVG